jgi:PAS domain S-box-containing protein
MVDIAILVLSVGFQIATVYVACSLIRLTEKSAAWLCISAALVLMAVRRGLPLLNVSVFSKRTPSDSIFEAIGLAISVLMFVGVSSIGPIFKRLYANEKRLRESEQQFRSYFELPIIGVAIVDGEHRYKAVNSKYCEILSAAKESIVGSRRLEWICAEDIDSELELLRGMEQGKNEGYTAEKRLIKESGSLIWVSQALRCVRNPDASINYYIDVSEDISRRKDAERALTSSLEEKEKLLRELYHRTKNNMQIICSLLQMECDRVSNQGISERFQVLESRILSMSLVQDKLYDFGDLSHIDLSDYVRELAEMISEKHRAEGRAIEIKTTLESVVISFDTAIPCGIILEELIANAYAHAFPSSESGVIDIALRKLSDGKIEIRVSDDGIGLPKAFDLVKYPGMGLDTVFGLCAQLKAQVDVSTGSGVGYTLVFEPDEAIHRV